MLTADEFYTALLTTIIRGKIAALGDNAIRTAVRTDCVECSPDGTVTAIRCEPVLATQKILDAYVLLTGSIAVDSAAAQTMALRMANDYPVPDCLR